MSRALALGQSLCMQGVLAIRRNPFTAAGGDRLTAEDRGQTSVDYIELTG